MDQKVEILIYQLCDFENCLIFVIFCFLIYIMGTLLFTCQGRYANK